MVFSEAWLSIRFLAAVLLSIAVVAHMRPRKKTDLQPHGTWVEPGNRYLVVFVTWWRMCGSNTSLWYAGVHHIATTGILPRMMWEGGWE